MEKMAFQTIRHRKVYKKSARSMMAKVNAAWFLQRALPEYLSLHTSTFIPTMASTDRWKESVNVRIDEFATKHETPNENGT